MKRGAGGVDGVVEAIVSYLQERHACEPAVKLLLDRFADVGLCVDTPPNPPQHAEALDDALMQLCAANDEHLARIGHAVREAAGSLTWAVDDGSYYSPDAPISDGYRRGNMNALLADGDDFAMGFFVLVPEVDYFDHRHDAPELYLNLTGPSEWRFDFGPWVEMSAGSVIWNEPGAVHATRSGARAWLSFWAWLKDIDVPCEVVDPPN